MNRKVVYDGRIVKLGIERVTLPNGAELDLEIIRHPGASAIVPMDSEGRVTLVNQHRHAAGGRILEVPAGILEPGETPQACATRELAEEVQLRAGTWVSLGFIHTTPGFTDEKIHLFLATGVEPTEGRPEADEDIVPATMPLADAIAATLDGNITDGKTICALHRAAHHLGLLGTTAP